jgi:hypothetical protein
MSEKAAQEGLNCWQRAEEKTFKILLFTKLILCLLTVMIMWFMYSYQFFAPKTTQEIAHGFTLLFLAAFIVIVVVNTLTVFCRYRRQKKLCSRTNCSFIWVMLCIFVLSLGIASKIVSKGREVQADLSQDCDSSFQIQNATSLLARLDDVSMRAQRLLCSEKCPCMMTRIKEGDYREL